MTIQKILTSKNYTKGRPDAATQKTCPINYGVFHTEADAKNDTQAGVAKWFQNPAAGSSAHYLVGLDGSIIQCVEEVDTAWHAANWNVNVRSIGIEHEDNGSPDDPVRTDAMYASAAQLVADICKRHSIPCQLVPVDASHNPVGPGWLRHKQVSTRGTACPDGLDCERIIREASAILCTGGAQ